VPTPSAQQPFLHLNPVVEKLAQGKHVFGVSTSDLSLQNARSLARDPNIDYVYIDMEHNAMRFDQLEIFLAGLTDKAGVLQRGNAQAHPAVFARFVPYGSEDAQWVVKHALDLGLMGILSNNVETAQQAENVVRTMRYMPQRDSKIQHPRGVRGTAGNGPWFWGVSGQEYRRRADLWPLNPQGDLIFWPMIETVEGVKNADAIARVPGVSGFYLGAAGDLSNSLGVPNSNDPSVEAEMAKILSVCQARNLPCGGTVSVENVATRMKQGYKIINFGGANGGLSAQNDAVRRATLAAGAKR
jgi:4-hydroxy-2-oxoheptanedioate aldolase